MIAVARKTPRRLLAELAGVVAAAMGHLMSKAGHLVGFGGHLHNNTGLTGCAACCAGTPPAKMLVTFPSDVTFCTTLITVGVNTVQWVSAGSVVAGNSYCLTYLGLFGHAMIWTGGGIPITIQNNGVPTSATLNFYLSISGVCNVQFLVWLDQTGHSGIGAGQNQYHGTDIVNGIIDPCTTSFTLPLAADQSYSGPSVGFTGLCAPGSSYVTFGDVATTGAAVFTPGGC